MIAPASWVNFDSSPRLRIERSILAPLIQLAEPPLFPRNVRYGDIVRGLPIEEASAEAVFSSHVLEHLPRDEVPRALANSFHMLKPGGYFRVIVPDLAWRASAYLRALQEGSYEANDRFLDACMMGQQVRARGIAGFVRTWWGNSAHRWMYDEASLINLLVEAGFVEIRRCRFGDSVCPAFAEVEDERRFYQEGHLELALEAVCPQSGTVKRAKV